jgi:hypothetical protein
MLQSRQRRIQSSARQRHFQNFRLTRGGNGVVARRTPNGWSAPVFYNIGGAVLTTDNSKNQAFYNLNAGEVLDKPESVSLTNVSVDLRGFSDIVKMYAK